MKESRPTFFVRETNPSVVVRTCPFCKDKRVGEEIGDLPYICPNCGATEAVMYEEWREKNGGIR